MSKDIINLDSIKIGYANLLQAFCLNSVLLTMTNNCKNHKLSQCSETVDVLNHLVKFFEI